MFSDGHSWGQYGKEVTLQILNDFNERDVCHVSRFRLLLHAGYYFYFEA